ncbi:MAG TPA: hydroxymethylbilane synthase, partial [Alcanivorax sp.]|nr:hydroxymethylbilane synthase [Alcanivorax sp.]
RADARELGIGIAESLLEQGADRILRELYDRA